jgi:hypothetical protein
MTFEEFFNKKRIDLVALKAGEPGLFAEFEKHFTQMGEKSFDHTKKYWFNKLRLQYHLAPEQKPEKMHLENRLAEQTIVETLTDTIPAPSAGFKPRFKAGMAAKPAETPEGKVETPAIETTTPAAETKEPSAETAPESTAPKPAFKPRFNMKMAAPKSAEAEVAKPETGPAKEATEPMPSAETDAPKPGFKPRFNMKTMAPKPAETEETKPEIEPEKEITESTPPAETVVPKPGFKPRFNMKTMAPKPAEDVVDKKEEVQQSAAEEKSEDITEPAPPEETPAAPKIGFKPRFNAKTMKPKPPEE